MEKKSKMREQRIISNILENFDFEKCHSVMTHLNWTWGINGKVPTIKELRKSAISRLTNAMDIAKEEKCHKCTYFSDSGGLKATAWVNKKGNIVGANLEFVLTDWDSDGKL